MNRGFSDARLFKSIRCRFHDGISTLVLQLRDDLQITVASHLAVVQTDLAILRDENIATESESNPELRAKIEQEIRKAKDGMEDAREVLRHED